MFYYLLYPLHAEYTVFNLFKYITFRAACAGATSLIISLLLGKFVINWLSKRKILAQVREKGIPSQESKTHIPTMGGVLVIGASVISALLWADLTEPYIWVAILSFIAFGIVGLCDDLRKVRIKKGISARQKMIWLIIISIGIGLYLYFFPKVINYRDFTTLIFFKNKFIYLGWLYVPFIIIVILSTTNAVNLTDGMDGLAIGLIAETVFTFAILAYAVGNLKFAAYLNIIHMPGAGELTVFLLAISGASLGFLWYNISPAQIIMGDTGALALGGIIGVAAILLKQEILLIIACGPFVIEALSVIFQVAYFKQTHGKRLFRMAPIHHHFEKMGIPENKIVVRFWIIGILFLLITLSTLKIR